MGWRPSRVGNDPGCWPGVSCAFVCPPKRAEWSCNRPNRFAAPGSHTPVRSREVREAFVPRSRSEALALGAWLPAGVGSGLVWRQEGCFWRRLLRSRRRGCCSNGRFVTLDRARALAWIKSREPSAGPELTHHEVAVGQKEDARLKRIIGDQALAMDMLTPGQPTRSNRKTRSDFRKTRSVLRKTRSVVRRLETSWLRRGSAAQHDGTGARL